MGNLAWLFFDIIHISFWFLQLFSKNYIRSLLIKCCRNDRGGQKQIFYLLNEFSLRVCYRYADVEDDPQKIANEGFLKLFKTIDHFDLNAEPDILLALKIWFKNILIDTCIENSKQYYLNLTNHSPDLDFQYICVNKKEKQNDLSPKDIVDAIKMLSAPYRMVFNLFVIDGFDIQAISSKLEIPVNTVGCNLNKARENLEKIIFNSNGLMDSETIFAEKTR